MSLEKTAAAKVLVESAIILRHLSAENAELKEKLASAETGLEEYQRASRIVNHMEGTENHHEKVAKLLNSGRRLDVLEEAVAITADPEALRLTKLASPDDVEGERGDVLGARIDTFLLTGELDD